MLEAHFLTIVIIVGSIMVTPFYALATYVFSFISAFFFGITSSEGPLQVFHPAITNNLILFPTGMIPLFLVPYAIFFHNF